MYRFLPRYHVNNLVKSYRVRLGTVFLIAITGVLVIGFIALIPAYVFVFTTKTEAAKAVAVINAELTQAGTPELEAKLADAQTIVSEFSADKEGYPLSEIIRSMSNATIPGIRVTTLEIAKSKEEKKAILQVQGIAASRDVLVLFRNNLSKEKTFEEVELPVSDLAKSRDIAFTIRLTALPKE